MSSQRCVPGLQDDLEVKLKELQSKSDSVTSLGECCRQTAAIHLRLRPLNLRPAALQVSTLTLQVTNLNSQVQQAVPWTKVKGRSVRAGGERRPPPRYLVKIKWGFSFPLQNFKRS